MSPEKPSMPAQWPRWVPGAAWAWSAIEYRRKHSPVRVLKDAALEAQRSKLPQMAAALSYRTVFGLIPVLVVALVAMKLFFTTEAEIADVLNQAMRYSGISSIAVGPVQDPAAMGPFPEAAPFQPPGSEEANRAGGGSAGNTRPELIPRPGPPATPEQEMVAQKSAERLDQWIKDLVRRVGSVNFRAIGLIGAIALVYAAISMLVEVERAFNQIYRVPLGRSWARRIVNYWTLLTLGALGLGTSFYVTEIFAAKVAEVARWAGVGGGNTLILSVIGFISTVSISLLMYLLIYTVVPNTRVKVGPALAGAAVAAVVWEASKWGFTQYLKFSTGQARLYGSIALVPLFLLWVYVTWCIVLFGLNVAYYLQHGRFHTAAQPVDLAEPTIVDPAATLSLMGAMVRRFQSGKPAEAADVSAELRIPTKVARDMLAGLLRAGLVNRIQRPEDNGSDEPLYALARPPERIGAEEVLKVGDELARAGADPVADAVRRARTQAVQGRDLASLMGIGRGEAATSTASAAAMKRPSAG